MRKELTRKGDEDGDGGVDLCYPEVVLGVGQKWILEVKVDSEDERVKRVLLQESQRYKETGASPGSRRTIWERSRLGPLARSNILLQWKRPIV